MDSKTLLFFKKKSTDTLVCTGQYMIFEDEDGYYQLEEENRFAIKKILGKQNYEKLISWMLRNDISKLELDDCFIVSVSTKDLEKEFHSYWEYMEKINHYIILQTEFPKEILEKENKVHLLNINWKKNLSRECPTPEKYAVSLPPISQIISMMQKSIIGQEEAIKKTVYAIYSNLNLQKRNLSLSEIITLKNNVLISGPSGSGKTEIARQLSNQLDIPVLIEDIKQYSGTGWKGNEISEILKKLYLISNKKLDVAEHSILVLDEIDKIAVRKNTHSHNTLEVQQGLLKIMEGGIYTLDINHEEPIPFDTKYLSIICSGAFEENQFNNFTLEKPKSLSKIDYINYGLIPEFVGRIKTYITLNQLSKEEQKRFLIESNLSLLKMELEYFKNKGITINLKCSMDQLCDEIIKKASTLSNTLCGLRDYNQIAGSIFYGLHYLEYDNISFDSVTIDLDIIDNPNNFKLEKKKI